MKPQRFFRASESVYEQVRSTLDAAWGLPSHGQQTCIDPAAVALKDAGGMCLLAVFSEFCNYSVAVDLLPQLLASGAVEEIDAATYAALLPAE